MAASCVVADKSTAEKKHKNSDYGNTFLNGLNKMRFAQKHCDFVLEVGRERIKVHKVALEIASPYFAGMFGKKREGKVKLKDVSINAVKTLVEYVYTGTITFTEDDVEGLLITSDLFQIDWVKKECEKFLESTMNSSNCFRIWSYSDMPSCKSLRDVAHKYILGHFDDLFEREELLLLAFEEIKELISRPPFLRNNVSTEPLLKEDPKYDKLLLDAAIYQLTPVNEQICVPGRVRTKKVTECYNENFHVFLLGGADTNNGYFYVHNRCKVYDFYRRKLVSIANMNSRTCKNSAIALNGTVYSMGGMCSGSSLKTAERYDPINKRWDYIAPMAEARSRFPICTHNGLIYVIGGLTGGTVERYSPAIDKWESCQSLPCSNYSRFSSAAVVDNNIYSFVRNSWFSFDPREGCWRTLKLMNNETCFRVVSYDHTLFCIGDGENKYLDVRVNRWESMPPKTKIAPTSAVVAADNIYLFGGIEATRPFKFDCSVERYNIRNKEWTIVDSTEIVHHSEGIVTYNG
ncbi:kelch-like protein 17 [Glossina fuscipes]|uniref:Kelch-like protein diablo n=1 Tax=Glossina fuscipes TaxID=7396 RepID=A0A9C6DVI6_9MUSC|nr:kelch-like protein 17 [Glossina fuscipes]